MLLAFDAAASAMQLLSVWGLVDRVSSTMNHVVIDIVNLWTHYFLSRAGIHNFFGIHN